MMQSNNERKKILFFLPSNTGGAERVTITIAKLLDKNKFEVKFVIVSKKIGNIINFIPKDYEIIRLPIRNIWYMATLRIYRILKKEKPNSVFCSLRYLSSRLIIAAKMRGNIKIVVRCENGLSNLRLDQRLLMRYTHPFADYIIAQQEDMRQELINIMHFNDKKILTIQNPIDTSTIDEKIKENSPYNKDDKSIKYVWVGRFDKTKGQDILIKAFHIVHKTNSNTHLYLIGKYDWNRHYDKTIKDLIQKYSLTEYIHCIGFDANPYRWIKHCDCFVLPSRLEGLPNSLIEALYLNRPVVATQCIPVINRIIKNGFNGYTIPTEDYNAMAKAMINALQLDTRNITYQSTSKEMFINLFN